MGGVKEFSRGLSRCPNGYLSVYEPLRNAFGVREYGVVSLRLCDCNADASGSTKIVALVTCRRTLPHPPPEIQHQGRMVPLVVKFADPCTRWYFILASARSCLPLPPPPVFCSLGADQQLRTQQSSNFNEAPHGIPAEPPALFHQQVGLARPHHARVTYLLS